MFQRLEILFVSFKIMGREFNSLVTLLNQFESIVVRVLPSRCMFNPLITTYSNWGLWRWVKLIENNSRRQPIFFKVHLKCWHILLRSGLQITLVMSLEFAYKFLQKVKLKSKKSLYGKHSLPKKWKINFFFRKGYLIVLWTYVEIFCLERRHSLDLL